MTNREAHPDYKDYPVGMRVKLRFYRDSHFYELREDGRWHTSYGTPDQSSEWLFGDDEFFAQNGAVIIHDPRTAGKPFSFNPVGDGTTKSSQPSALLVALREAQAAIQRAIEEEAKGGN